MEPSIETHGIIQIINNWTVRTINEYDYTGQSMEDLMWEQQSLLVNHLHELERKAESFDEVLALDDAASSIVMEDSSYVKYMEDILNKYEGVGDDERI